MTKSDLNSIEQLREQLYAVQQLLLAHCVALGAEDPRSSETALEIARGQADSCRIMGRPIAARRLTLLIEQVDQVLS